MPEVSYPQNSLILYKGRPGRIRLAAKKLEIELEGGQTRRVRPKDVILLHPGPIDDLAQLVPPAGDIETAWELLAGETTTLADLAELAYGEFTPASAWAAWQLVDDGLFFQGTPEAITALTPAVVAEKQSARAAKAAAEQAWQTFLNRIDAGTFAPEDSDYLQDVTALAWEQRGNSQVLRALGQAETAQNAHALLLKIGYWDHTVNPYPQRMGAITTMPKAALPELPAEDRRDLTHLLTLAIDDEDSRDPDDALSWDDGRLWVHIADVAALVTPDSDADHEARERGATLYLPEGAVPMLPPAATRSLALGLADVSPALSFKLDIQETGEVAIAEIVPSWIKVTRLSYSEAENKLETEPFRQLNAVAKRYQERRQENGAIVIDLPEVKIRVQNGQVEIRPLPPLNSRDLVREAMLMTGEAVARLAQVHEIPLPFTTQATPEMDEPTGDTPSGMFARRRQMKRSQQTSAPGPHAGLGMDIYVQATSPLRRYLDLVVHQQLRAFLDGRPLLDAQAVMERVGAADAVSGSLRRAERFSNEHWTLVYLQQHPDWTGAGIVIEKRGKRDVILIPELALETQLYQNQDVPLDSTIQLKLTDINLAELEAHFQRIS